mgnify:CR=1 FL=1
MTTPLMVDFEKAFDKGQLSEWTQRSVALWAARWMAEKIAQEFEIKHTQFHQTLHTETIADEIRQMLKELS